MTISSSSCYFFMKAEGVNWRKIDYRQLELQLSINWLDVNYSMNCL